MKKYYTLFLANFIALGYPVALLLLVASPLIWLWGLHIPVYYRTAITAIYLLSIIQVLKRWILPKQ